MKKQFIITGILAVLCFWILQGAFKEITQLEQLYTGWSLRLETAITASDARQLKRHCAENADESGGIWPGFWTEATGTAKTDRAEQQAAFLRYDGDTARMFPVDFLFGSYPGEQEEARCAISSGLSWSLWGSLETTGKTLWIDGTPYTVSGIYQEEAQQVLLKGNADTQWTAIDLFSQDILLREDVAQFLAETRLPAMKSMVDGSGINALARLGVYMPLGIAGFVALLLFFLKDRQNHRKTVKNLLLAALLLAFACSLPLLLGILPGWLIPTKWSDFSFWATLLEKCKGYFLQWLALVPTGRDVLAKQILLSLALRIAGVLILLPVFYHCLSLEKRKERP